jgi:Ca-activated chloride channel family protein
MDWILAESLTGASQVALANVQLEVRFNPAVVARYRLIGHGSQLRPAAAAVELRSGQIATALYEVETIGNTESWVARAQLSWRDSASGEPLGSSEASLVRSELDTAFVGSAPSFQLAVVAAEMSEALKKSPYLRVPIKQALARAEVASRLIATDVRELPQNKQFIQFLTQLRRVRSW